MICPQGFFEYLDIIGLRKKFSERGVFDFLLGVIGTWVQHLKNDLKVQSAWYFPPNINILPRSRHPSIFIKAQILIFFQILFWSRCQLFMKSKDFFRQIYSSICLRFFWLLFLFTSTTSQNAKLGTLVASPSLVTPSPPPPPSRYPFSAPLCRPLPPLHAGRTTGRTDRHSYRDVSKKCGTTNALTLVSIVSDHSGLKL